MKHYNVLPGNHLRVRSPLVHTVLIYLLLDKFNVAPQWYGVAASIIVAWWVVWAVAWWIQDPRPLVGYGPSDTPHKNQHNDRDRGGRANVGI